MHFVHHFKKNLTNKVDLQIGQGYNHSLHLNILNYQYSTEILSPQHKLSEIACC